MSEPAQIIEISGLRRTRFYAQLYGITSPMIDPLIKAIEYCRTVNAQGGEFANEAGENLGVYARIAEEAFPDIFTELFGDDEC
jgi:hypothetical protein